jgi:phage gpG-like protein
MITVRVEGERVVVRGYEQWTARAESRLKFLVRKHTLAIANKAKLRVRVNSGRLRSSIADTYENDGLDGIAGTNVEYAVYEEFGTGIYAANGNGRKTPWVYFNAKLGRFVRTVGSPPRPFLLPSFNEQAPLFARDVEQMLREEAR